MSIFIHLCFCGILDEDINMNKDKILLEFREPTPLGVYEIVDYNEEFQSIMPPVFTDSIDTDCSCEQASYGDCCW